MLQQWGFLVSILMHFKISKNPLWFTFFLIFIFCIDTSKWLNPEKCRILLCLLHVLDDLYLSPVERAILENTWRINWFMADSFQVWVTLNLHTTSYKRYYFCTNQNVFGCSYVEVNWRRVIHSVCKSHLNTSYKTHILAVFLCILRRLLGQRLEKKSRRSASEEQRASLH